MASKAQCVTPAPKEGELGAIHYRTLQELA